MSDEYEPDDDLGLEWRDDDILMGEACPHCQSTLTDDVATLWQDETLICLAHQCFWCGKSFETVKPIPPPSQPADTDGIPF